MPAQKLSPAAVVNAAIEVADTDGLEAVTMRRVARELGVEAMSLYHHFSSKDLLLDAMVDRVYAAITLPAAEGPWRVEVRRRSESVREVLRGHPWALPLMESQRRPGPANLAYHEANIACLRAAGLTAPQVARAYAIIDAFVYGFVLQELMLPFDTGPEAADMVSEGQFSGFMATHPQMAWFAENVIMRPGYSFGREFGPGLDLVLEGIAASHATTAPL